MSSIKRKLVLLGIVVVLWGVNASILEVDRLYRTTLGEVAAPPSPPAVGFVEIVRHCIGVKGDGKTDDSAALQACIDGTSPAPMEFYFPPQTYLLGNAIELRSDRHGVSIIGSREGITMFVGKR